MPQKGHMSTATVLTASTTSINQALALLDGEFAGMAEGIAQNRYVFWLG